MRFKTNNDKLLKNSMKKMENKRLNRIKQRGVNESECIKPSNLHELMQNVSNRGLRHASVTEGSPKQSFSVCIENSAKSYAGEVQKVIEQSDVIVEVIDARDPIGSRSKEIEALVLAHGSSKRLVILMNKIDLVPPSVVRDWVKSLRGEFPTIPFKASTQDQPKNLGRFNDFYSLGDSDLRHSKCSGADLLLSLLGNYCRCKDIRTKITVGIVGFPNTGKSSVINSLKRRRVCTAGSLAGVTRSLQTVQLTNYIQLIDSPGIILKSPQDNTLKAVLANCVCPQKITDPIAIADEIIRLVPPEEMLRIYGISETDSVDQFLSKLALKKGHLKQGGVPHLEEAAISLLKDWNEGRIIHYVHVSNAIGSEDLRHVDAQIVKEMSKEFDIDALCSFDMDYEASGEFSNELH